MALLPLVLLFLANLLSAEVTADTACDGKCAKTFKKCTGSNIFSLKSCCKKSDQCVKRDKKYGQCRPKSKPIPAGWLGVTVDCRDCGVDSMQSGEFNFLDEYCDITSLGQLTLDECASACQEGGYVACDRFAGSPDEQVGCYGYFELFEGGCYKRNDNDAWTSWLNCKGAGPTTRAAPVALAATADDSGIPAEELKAQDEAGEGP